MLKTYIITMLCHKAKTSCEYSFIVVCLKYVRRILLIVLRVVLLRILRDWASRATTSTSSEVWIVVTGGAETAKDEYKACKRTGLQS